MELAHLFRKRGVWNTTQHLTFPRYGSCSINLYSRGMASGFGYIRPSRQL